MRVALFVPNREPYPFEALKVGLERSGHQIVSPSPDSAEWLITWTPWLMTQRDSLLKAFGPKRTIVVENGWLSPLHGVQYYQLAIGGWNGRGEYPTFGPSRMMRWELFRFQHRTCPPGERRDILILEQIGHSIDERTAPRNWAFDALRVLEKHYGPGRVRIRLKRDQKVPLLEDLDRASDVVTHSSNAAHWAMVKGINVFAASPNFMSYDIVEHWDGQSPLLAAGRQCDPWEKFKTAAWCQWTADEIRAGHPFDLIFGAKQRGA